MRSPSAPSLRAIGARCWVGVPPLPFTPCWPLALGARNRSGGAISSVSLYAASLPSCSLLGVSSPPPPAVDACVLWPHRRPWPVQALRWLGLLPTQLPLCRTYNTSACYFRLWLQPHRWSVLVGTLRHRIHPPSPRPALPSRLVTPRRLCHQLGAPWWFWRWVGFSYPLPIPRLSSPHRDRNTMGAPRVNTPLGSPFSLGIESSHDYSNPHRFDFGVKSSCHDSTPPTPLLGVKLSWDDATPPSSP